MSGSEQLESAATPDTVANEARQIRRSTKKIRRERRAKLRRHAAAIQDAIVKNIGGIEEFAAMFAEEIKLSQPGSAVRQKLLTQFMSMINSSESKLKKREEEDVNNNSDPAYLMAKLDILDRQIAAAKSRRDRGIT